MFIKADLEDQEKKPNRDKELKMRKTKLDQAIFDEEKEMCVAGSKKLM